MGVREYYLREVLTEARRVILKQFKAHRGEYDTGEGDDWWAEQVPPVVAKIDRVLDLL